MQNRWMDLLQLLLRIGGGGFMLTHGWPKFEKLIAGGEIKFADPIGLGPEVSLILTVFAEFLCSILILIGFRTKLATIPLIITMAVAAFIVHGDDSFGKQEKALLYSIVYIAIVILGPGQYSLDSVMKRRK